MNVLLREQNIKFLLFQRNVFAAITVLLSISLILSSSFLFFKHERVVVVPPVVEREFWVDANNVSPAYIEQFGYFLGQLLFTKSAQSAAAQRAILLRHAEPAYAGALRQRLIEEEEILQKQSTAYVFYPIETKVNPEKMILQISGERLVFVGGKQISSSIDGYSLKFSYSGSKLLLKEVSAEKKEGIDA